MATELTSPEDDPPPGGPTPIWLREAHRPSARRTDPLSLERIVAAAVAELDAHGAERLTMRRLAQRLEVTSTALYWHVTTKEDLLDLAVDTILGEVSMPEDEDGPRPALRGLLVGWRATMLAHPWSPTLLARPLLGPNSLARMEFLQVMLTRAGLAGAELAAATRLLADLVIGAAVIDATWRRLDGPTLLPRVRARITDLDHLYPTLSSSGFVDVGPSDDELFEAGLDRTLDALIAPA